MFTFHDDKVEDLDGPVLVITLDGGIHSDYHNRLNLKHCNSLSQLDWGSEETLCATVYVLNLDMAQHLIKFAELFGISEILVCADAEANVPELSLLSARRLTPLEYLAVLDGDSKSSDDKPDEEIDDDGVDDSV